MSNNLQVDLPAPSESQPSPPVQRRPFSFARFYRANRESINLWLTWRLALLVVVIFTAVLVPRNPNSPLTFNNFGDLLRERVFWGWTHWDGDWYADIAAQGYWREANSAFF